MLETGSGPEVARRAALFGVVCAALTVAFPASAGAGGAASGPDCNRPAQGSSPLGSSPQGSSQSPIDLREKDITFVDSLPSIDFCYPRTDVTLVNIGSPDKFATVRADVPAGAAFITVSGVRHDLVQFHWHTPSEHKIEGRETPLEMHLLHRMANGSLLVIGIFIERGGTNSAMESIFRELPEKPGATRAVQGVDLRGLLPAGCASFRYSGSLTVPPFTEDVRFVLLADSINLTDQQIGTFQGLFPNGNSRPVQPLNGREILSDRHVRPHLRQ